MIRNWRGMLAGTAILAGCGLALSPAVGSVDSVLGTRSGAVSLATLGSIGSFTPVTTDKRLARAYAQALTTVQSQGFRFTPTAGSMSGRRSITIVVRAPDLGLVVGAGGHGAASTIGLGPVAYNLGAARGLGRFATEISASHDNDPLVTASALAVPRNFKLDSNSGTKRLSTTDTLENLAQSGTSSQALATEKSYAYDLGGSYKLTHNLDVTAGLRSHGRQYRLSALTDDAQDSQAVYLGTTFKF